MRWRGGGPAMNGSVSAPARRRHRPRLPAVPLHPAASWVVPVVLGVLTGGYAMFIGHNQGSTLPFAALLGVVAAVVIGAVCYLLGRVQGRLLPEVRAGLYGSLLGCVIGFLYCLSGAAVGRATGVGLGVALSMGAVSFYIIHARSD
ncbi:hypothetical protein EEJ42_02920 [Streptomyces botrytidirepellens]|uniref:Uncharacterized protein n=2 Tax=Streptomyces botrytidirepellens TaxID=2486417 RepID=A0A3M8X6Q8_9ACTN|nr:hypothetical protein EEJ42_02920 [Streptomyces botrytidirepellens]